MTLGCTAKEAGRPSASSFIWSVSQEDGDDGDNKDFWGRCVSCFGDLDRLL